MHRFLSSIASIASIASIVVCMLPAAGNAGDGEPSVSRAELRTVVEKAGFGWGAPMYVRIFKESSELEVWLDQPEGYRLFRVYAICRWSGELGPKTRDGDGQSPEGFYRVTAGAMNPSSKTHLAWDLGYPNDLERRMGWTGSAMGIHGGCESTGGYAMTDTGIDALTLLAEAAFIAGANDIPVHVFPFRMVPDRVRAAEGLPWYGYWRFQLYPAYEEFERTRRPPAVGVAGGRYVLSP